ncbi:cysteine dioxygenase family protein [Hyalangium rubrum]|uniref:Cysteine dioxygenase family protein n=1 Tax=Hyalangium rubrum TaxID=3103134 RepID=A0ABU5HES9_9BACT|nr:cysteine dioxygenase family protein [Hyalangium sp. s54d21]MDY7231980.1 cysteine dioxygenase family protein [Hyalangium sp. s54d21]
MLDTFIDEIASAALATGEPEFVTQRVREALTPWLAQGLPDTYVQPAEGCYARHVIHCDPLERFCIVSIVLRPGQSTPIHNHTTWGVIGVVTGREREVRFRRSDTGGLQELESRFNAPGDTAVVIPPRDVHRIEGACPEGKPTVSIHIYGGNVDRVTRTIFEQKGVEYAGPCATSYHA